MEPALGTWEAIDTLRTVRAFADRPLEAWAVERILNAGRRPGSSKNLQRWSFIVCRDRDHLRELSTTGPWAGHLAGAAIAVALVTPDPRAEGAPLSIAFDLGRAAQNMLLAAWELGIGSAPPPSTSMSGPAGCWASRRGCTASTCCRSAIRPSRPC